MKRIWFILSIGFFWFLMPTQSVKAADVLVAYDSQNITAEGNQTLANVVQQLSSLNQTVTLQSIDAYRSGELNQYQGLVTVINWPNLTVTNNAFLRDRARFNGATVHIGANLMAAEQQQLQIKPEKVTHRQFEFQLPNNHVLLPFQDGIWQLVRDTSGPLIDQGTTVRYAYTSQRGNHGYVPFWQTGGVANVQATALLKQVFQSKVTTDKVLMLTQATPLNDMQVMRATIDYLAGLGVNYGISTTWTSDNTTSQAAKRYTWLLRRAEINGAQIYLKVNGTTATNLKAVLDQQLKSLTQAQVFPTGMTVSLNTATQVQRAETLKRYTDTLLVLPAADVGHLAAGTRLTAKKLYSGQSLSTPVAKTAVANPTALTLAMPTTAKELQAFKQQLTPLAADFSDTLPASTLRFGTHTFSYQGGQYLRDGETELINETSLSPAKIRRTRTQVSRLNRFFDVQSVVLSGVLLVVLGVLLILLLIGRHYYRGMFKQKK
ncbi:hypothetical protein [Lacticaseibacillus saniviri]